MKVAVFRLRGLDTELAEMLQEADGRCSTEFALKIDDLRERIAPRLMAIQNNEARMMRNHSDKDGKGNPKPNEQGRLQFSTADQQDKLAAEMQDLAMSTIDVDDDLPKLRKADLVANGLHTSGTRIANLRPLLDTSVPDEPGASGRDERSVLMPAAGRIPHA